MQALKQQLRSHGVSPTHQRLEIAKVLFAQPAHLSADQIYRQVNSDGVRVSKATVYNTLGLFVARGLVREVLVDPSKVFYDSNTTPHHHIYNVASGALTDVAPTAVAIAKLPDAPAGTVVDGVDVIIRVRPE